MSRGDWDQTANPEPEVDPEPARKVDRPRTPLKARSKKTVARAPERDAVRVAVGTMCVLAWHSDCGGPLDVHELVRRGQMKDAPYIRELCVPLCRTHHDLDVRMSVAERLGIRMPRWVWDQHGLAAVAECERIRAAHGGTPFWRETHDARWLGIEHTE